MFKINEIYPLAPEIFYANMEAPLVARKAEAGQFVIVRVSEKGERIPLTIADFDREKGTITLVFQKSGKSTSELASKKKGGFIKDLLGPQGNPSLIENFGRIAVIGGGVGVAAVYPIARKLKEAGNFVTLIAGFRSKKYLFWTEKLKEVSDSLIITTNDGSSGQRGFVTDILQDILIKKEKFNRILAIGPAVMMKSVAALTGSYPIKTVVSLNSMMVCGMGMCGACRVTAGKIIRFTCMDGPEFDAQDIDFDELILRLNSYKNDEKICLERWAECGNDDK